MINLILTTVNFTVIILDFFKILLFYTFFLSCDIISAHTVLLIFVSQFFLNILFLFLFCNLIIFVNFITKSHLDLCTILYKFDC